MKKLLIPQFIMEKYRSSEFCGSLGGSVILLDISGFTSFTEKQMTEGKEGAEKVSYILNKHFSFVIRTVYLHNGFITNFLGDGFMAVFPEMTIEQALITAQNVKTAFSLAQKNNLKCKLAVAAGNIDWKIIDHNDPKTYLFYGNVVTKCFRLEKQAGLQEILFDHSEVLKQKDIDFERKGDVSMLRSVSKQPIEQSKKSDNIIKQVRKTPYDFPEEISDEFRNVINCFLKLKHVPAEILLEIIHLVKNYGGYFKDIVADDDNLVILVYFGTPKAIEKPFLKALGFSLKCKEILKDDLKIGLAFGTVFSGFILNKYREDFLTIGEKVNLAARLCSRADWGDIYADREVYSNSKNKFVFQQLANQTLKGFSDKISCFVLNGKLKRNRKTETQLVGREKEIKTLHSIFLQVESKRKAGLIFLNGKAGIGKSFLVANFRQRLAKNRVGFYRFPSNELIHSALNPIIRFLKEYFDQNEKKTYRENWDKFTRKFTELITIAGNKKLRRELRRTKSILAALLGFTRKNSLYQKLTAKEKYNQRFVALTNLIKIEASNKTVVMDFDDVQWIDNESISFLQYFCDEIRNFPILIICSSRSQQDNIKLGLEDFPEVQMEICELQSQKIQNLISSKLGSSVSKKVFDEIWEQSGGNPFYVEQIVMYFREKEFIELSHNEYVFSPKYAEKELKIPESINSIIIARIDDLTAELKKAVKAASVLGLEFASEILSHLLKKKQIDRLLQNGKEEEIWQTLNQINYIFKHALIRDSAYQMQLKKHLRSLHKLAGETYEKIRDACYDEMAYHFEEAGLKLKAVKYLKKAGNRAEKNYQNRAAIECYMRILNLSSPAEKEQKIDYLIKQGCVYRLIGKSERSKENFDKALKIAENIADAKRSFQIKSQLGTYYKRLGNPEISQKYFTQVFDFFSKSNDMQNLFQASLDLGGLKTSVDSYSEAERYYTQAVEIAEKLGKSEQLAAVYGEYGILLKKMGNYNKALALFQKKISLSKEQNNIRSIAYAHNNVGNIQMNKGEYFEAEQSFNKALKIVRKIGDRYAEDMITGNLGIIYMNTGRKIKALNYFKRSIKICEEIEDNFGIAVNNGNMAILLKNLCRFEEALQCVNTRIEMNKKLGDKSGTAFAYGNLGNIYVDQGKVSKAENSYNKMLEISANIGYKIGIALAKGNLANVYLIQGKLEKALRCLKDEIKIEKELDLKSHLIQSLNGITSLYIKRGELQNALKRNKEAIDISKSIGSKNGLIEAELNAYEINFLSLKEDSQKAKAISNYMNKLRTIQNEYYRAMIYAKSGMHYEMIRNSERAAKNWNKAVNIFEKLYKQKPFYETKLRIDELKKLISKTEI